MSDANANAAPQIEGDPSRFVTDLNNDVEVIKGTGRYELHPGLDGWVDVHQQGLKGSILRTENGFIATDPIGADLGEFPNADEAIGALLN